MDLSGTTALITGGTSGIGRATAELFANQGAAVAFTGRDEDRGTALAELIRAGGRDALFVRADVRSAAECATTVEATLAGRRRLVRRLYAGSSYLSSEDPRVHLGLGDADRVERLVVRRPGGRVTTLRDLAADRIVAVRAPG